MVGRVGDGGVTLSSGIVRGETGLKEGEADEVLQALS